MAIAITKSLALPFNSSQSLVRTAVGTALLLPAAYFSDHFTSVITTVTNAITPQIRSGTVDSHAMAQAALNVLLVIVTVFGLQSVFMSGYSVRVMRDRMSRYGDGALPSWLGHPGDFLKSFCAAWLGAIVIGVMSLVVWGAALFLASLVYHAYPDGAVGVAVGTGLALLLLGSLPVWVAGSMMMAHFAWERRFSAVFDWSEIYAKARGNWFALVTMNIVNVGILLAIDLKLPFWPVSAFVTFVSTVIVSDITAQIYKRR